MRKSKCEIKHVTQKLVYSPTKDNVTLPLLRLYNWANFPSIDFLSPPSLLLSHHPNQFFFNLQQWRYYFIAILHQFHFLSPPISPQNRRHLHSKLDFSLLKSTKRRRFRSSVPNLRLNRSVNHQLLLLLFPLSARLVF